MGKTTKSGVTSQTGHATAQQSYFNQATIDYYGPNIADGAAIVELAEIGIVPPRPRSLPAAGRGMAAAVAGTLLLSFKPAVSNVSLEISASWCCSTC
jgi:hypothetical protein